MKRTAFLGSSLLFMMVLLIPKHAWAQADGDAYREYYAEEDLGKRLVLGEQFLAKYKDSQYTESVYRQVVQGYYKLNNFPKVVSWAEKLDEYAKEATPAQKFQTYSIALDAAQKANIANQIVAYAEKVLTIMPEDLNALITLADKLSQDKTTQDKASNFAKKGLEVLGKTKASDLNFSDAEWAKQKPAIAGQMHTTIGSVLFTKGDYDKAVEPLTEATKATPKDGGPWYLLGLSFNQQYQAAVKKAEASREQTNTLIKNRAGTLEIEDSRATTEALQEVARGKRDQALDALASSVALGGPTATDAKKQLERIYTQSKGSTDGLDQLIAQKQTWAKTLP